jgi:hypothetical protein
MPKGNTKPDMGRLQKDSRDIVNKAPYSDTDKDIQRKLTARQRVTLGDSGTPKYSNPAPARPSEASRNAMGPGDPYKSRGAGSTPLKNTADDIGGRHKQIRDAEDYAMTGKRRD